MAAKTLLEGPAPPSCTSRLIDFTKEGLPEYDGYFAMAIDDFATPEECTALIAAAESTAGAKWEQAMINVGGGRQKMDVDTRNCGRIIYDDRELARRIRDRLIPYLPQDIVTLKNEPDITGSGPAKRGETWQVSRLNERLRFLKYTSGNYFRAHCDGTYVTEDGKEASFLTIHIYLNGGSSDPENETVAVDEQREQKEVPWWEEQPIAAAHAASMSAPTNGPQTGAEADRDSLDLVGGATRFYSWRRSAPFDYVPKLGACIAFQQRHLLHSGEDVIQGTKYTMRTDILYEKVENPHQ